MESGVSLKLGKQHGLAHAPAKTYILIRHVDDRLHELWRICFQGVDERFHPLCICISLRGHFQPFVLDVFRGPFLNTLDD